MMFKLAAKTLRYAIVVGLLAIVTLSGCKNGSEPEDMRPNPSLELFGFEDKPQNQPKLELSSNPAKGEFHFSLTVYNFALSDAKDFAIECDYYGTDDFGNKAMQLKTEKMIVSQKATVPGFDLREFSAYLDWPGPGRTGKMKFDCVVDSKHQLAELDEFDNEKSYLFDVP